MRNIPHLPSHWLYNRRMSKKIELLTTQTAADRLKLSTRRLSELAAEGKLTRHRAYDPDTKREAFMFDAAEITAFQERRQYIAASLPGEIAAPAPAAIAVRPRLAELDDDEPAAADAFRLWLTLIEAAEYSGLPASILQAMIEAGKLRALNVGVRPGGHWRVRKLDVDAIEGDLLRKTSQTR